MPETPISDRLAGVRATIADNQPAGTVRIVAVTKTHGPDAVRAAAEAGLTIVGENRVPEAIAKQDEVGRLGIEWHFIGALQRRKVRDVIGRFSMIHSVDRQELAQAIHDRSSDSEQSVLVQVNCSGEPQKGGVTPSELPRLLNQIRALSNLTVSGLMTMAAFGADESELHRTFAQLRVLSQDARSEGHQMKELSMGMSNDYPIAVQEGATMLRLGSVLFGHRQSANEKR